MIAARHGSIVFLYDVSESLLMCSSEDDGDDGDESIELLQWDLNNNVSDGPDFLMSQIISRGS